MNTEGEDLPEILTGAYDNAENGVADSILITRSNRRAAEYNAGIRGQVLYGIVHLFPAVARQHGVFGGQSVEHYFGFKYHRLASGTMCLSTSATYPPTP